MLSRRTLFSLTNAPGLITDEQAVTYMSQNYAPNATPEEIANLALLYPQDPEQGSPYGTGFLNQLTPQFKRIASLTGESLLERFVFESTKLTRTAGDLAFQSPRRHFLKFASLTQPTWAYAFKRGKATPFLGSFHSSELALQFTTGPTGGIDNQFIDYLVNFVTKLDPNDASNLGLINWPRWSDAQGSPSMLAFLDRPLGGVLGLAIQSDTYRKAAMDFLIQLALKYPI